MATKQAPKPVTDELLADEYLADLVYDALLERGDPSKVSEITLEIDNPRITFPLVRRIVSDSPRFITIDRQWDLAARYFDRSRPTEGNLRESVDAAGKPMSTIQMATELSAIYRKGAETYFSLLNKAVQNTQTYFKANKSEYGLASWLPLVDAEEEEDVLFDNNLTRARLAPFAEASTNANWSPARYADATLALVEQARQPISHRLLGVLAWLQLREGYDPRKHFEVCLADKRLVWLTGKGGGRWITRAHADRLERILEERGAALAGEDTNEEASPAKGAKSAESTTPSLSVTAQTEAVSTNGATAAKTEPTATVAAVPAAPEVRPLDVSEADLGALLAIATERGGPAEVSELLALRYEVVAGDPSFRSDVDTLTARLKADERFLYVGAGRFREANSLPLFVYSLPDFLSFPDLQFVSMDGEIMDEEIADEGFAGTLRQDILSPLTQDAGDDEGRYTGREPENTSALRLVVKAHHKEIGTFPLCQFSDDFLPGDAPVVEVTIRDANGEAHNVIVNHEIRLAFNWFGLYEALNADSGPVFLLHKTARPFEFRFEAQTETDPLVYVSPARTEELMGLREAAEEGGDMATFDLACEVLANYPKGLDFVQAFTEVNIIRRVTRRKLASILSNYFCFVQKPGQSLWRFDAKMRDRGTDRNKRKYIKR